MLVSPTDFATNLILLFSSNSTLTTPPFELVILKLFAPINVGIASMLNNSSIEYVLRLVSSLNKSFVSLEIKLSVNPWLLLPKFIWVPPKI